ncbi:odorant receptor 131-2-like [Engraulis encrasicolus]|uniref:odorant receptor 131-2-like n=1 Tax=Engraulis encrasicolus TaxID=184585 RepID=UPI002FD50887
MNFTRRDDVEEALAKNLVIVTLVVIINCVNAMLVFTYFRNSAFHCDTRYILYIHLVINDMIMLSMSATLFVLTYVNPIYNVSVCCLMIVIAATTHKNTPLILACMAIERYIAICKPLHHAQICTVPRTYALIGIIWGVGVAPTLADVIALLIERPAGFFYTNIFCYNENLFTSTYYREKLKVVPPIYLSFVWLILIFTYIRIVMVAKKAKGDSSAKKAHNTVLLHGIQLLLCMMSYVSRLLNMILVPFFPEHRSKISFFTYLITSIVPRLLSTLIYGLRDQAFSKRMSVYFSCKVTIVKVKPDMKGSHD